MWKLGVTLLAKHNLQDLNYQRAALVEKDQRQIIEFIIESIEILPWHLRRPLKGLAACIALVSIFQKNISSFATRLPFYGMADKFIRSFTLLALFDIHSPAIRNRED